MIISNRKENCILGQIVVFMVCDIVCADYII